MTKLDDYQWLFRKAPTMATSIGENGRYLDVNDALLTRLSYEREDMIGKRPADFVTTETAERIEKELLPTLRRTGRLENKPVAFVARDGEVVNCLTNSLVERSSDGAFVRTIAMYSEATDQSRADWKYRQLYRCNAGNVAHGRRGRLHHYCYRSLAAQIGLHPGGGRWSVDHGFL